MSSRSDARVQNLGDSKGHGLWRGRDPHSRHLWLFDFSSDHNPTLRFLQNSQEEHPKLQYSIEVIASDGEYHVARTVTHSTGKYRSEEIMN
eukprot:1507111-Amphidinium_carterae.1